MRFTYVSIILILLYVPISGADLNGQFTSELYVTETDGQNHVQPYERLRADLGIFRDSGGKSLLLHSYLRWTTDLSERRPGDPRTFIYDTYLKLTGFPGRSAFYLGRQFVYNGAGSVLIDGMRFTYKSVREVAIDIFGGSSVSRLDPEQVRSLSDFGSYGGRLSFHGFYRGRVALNWMMRRAEGYVKSHRLGLDGRLIINRLDLYAKFTYNVANLRAAGIVIRSMYNFGKWNVLGEFTWREPSVSSNTLFSLIDVYRYKEIRVDVQRLVWRYLTVVGQAHVTMFEDDESWRTGLGVRSGLFSIIWRHQEGYGGVNDALQGNATVRLAERWEAYAWANLGRYRIQELQEDRSDSYAGRIGIRWRTGKSILASTEVQYLRNAVDRRDVRLYIRLSTNFSWMDDRGDKMR